MKERLMMNKCRKNKQVQQGQNYRLSYVEEVTKSKEKKKTTQSKQKKKIKSKVIGVQQNEK